PVVNGVARSSAPSVPSARVASSTPDSETGSGTWSQSGWRLSTSGIAAKLNSGVGDPVAHSRLSAPHGSGPATLPLRRETKKFQSVRPVPIAKTKPPTVATWFNASQPTPLG